MTPRNRRKSQTESGLNESIMMDLMGSKKKKRRHSLDLEIEAIKPPTKSIRSNPFSVNRDRQTDFDYDINDSNDDVGDAKTMKYSQSSQSGSERQMEDLLKMSKMQIQRDHER